MTANFLLTNAHFGFGFPAACSRIPEQSPLRPEMETAVRRPPLNFCFEPKPSSAGCFVPDHQLEMDKRGYKSCEPQTKKGRETKKRSPTFRLPLPISGKQLQVRAQLVFYGSSRRQATNCPFATKQDPDQRRSRSWRDRQKPSTIQNLPS